MSFGTWTGMKDFTMDLGRQVVTVRLNEPTGDDQLYAGDLEGCGNALKNTAVMFPEWKGAGDADAE